MMRKITEIPATIIVLLPVPSHTIIRGAKADLGREFKMTRYGSIILLTLSKESMIMAIKILSRFTIRKLRIVSYKVIPVCKNISKLRHISMNNKQMREGELKKNGRQRSR